MHTYIGIIALLCLIYDIALSENACLTPQNPCECVLPDKTIIDLSSVGLFGKPRFYDISFDSNCSEVYLYNPCYAFDSPHKYTTTNPASKTCAGASACVRGFGGNDGTFPEEHAIGFQHTAVFGKKMDQYYINYTVPGSSKVLQVMLNCLNDSSGGHYLTMNESTCSNSTDLIVLTLSSKCACANGCPKAPPSTNSSPGLSTGSKLLITFFTILLAYLIIGIVWNYCNGSRGMELLPNIEFWNDLPTLIMEGVVFTCSCCGRQSSYGEV